MSTIISEAEHIDILINNAAIGPNGPMAETPLSEYRRVWETNVGGVVTTTQEVFPHMAARKSGTIMNVSSVSAILPS